MDNDRTHISLIENREANANEIVEKILALRNEGKTLFEELQKPVAAELVVEGKAFPGNTVWFGSEKLLVREVLTAVKFFQCSETGEVRSQAHKKEMLKKNT